MSEGGLNAVQGNLSFTNLSLGTGLGKGGSTVSLASPSDISVECLEARGDQGHSEHSGGPCDNPHCWLCRCMERTSQGGAGCNACISCNPFIVPDCGPGARCSACSVRQAVYGLGEVNFAAPPPLEGPENSFLVGDAPPLARPPQTQGGEATPQLGVINRLGLSQFFIFLTTCKKFAVEYNY